MGAETVAMMISVLRQGVTVVGTRPAKLVAAHRGFHDGTAPYENTIPAFRRAIVLGADLLETDVRRTADGVLVLHHDASIDGVSIARSRLADLPLLPSGERIGTLQELVDLTATTGGESRLLVETKEHGYEREIVSMLRARLQPDQFSLFSFDLDSVRALRELAPDSKVGVLVGFAPDWKTGHWALTGAQMVARARSVGADFVSMTAMLATNGALQALADARIGAAVWTVDDRLQIQKFLADTRVQTIITNHPDTAMALRDRRVPALLEPDVGRFAEAA